MFSRPNFEVAFIALSPFHNLLSYAKFNFEDDQLRQIFKHNSNPVTLTDQCVKTFLIETFVPKKTLITVPKKIFQ